MNITLNIKHYLTPTIRKSFCVNKQAFAQTVPFILEDLFPELSVLYLDKGRLVLQDLQDTRYKVVCSSNNIYDVYPSFTKGHDRTKDGVDWLSSLSKVCSKIILVNIKNVDEITVKVLDVKALPKDCKGKVSLDE